MMRNSTRLMRKMGANNKGVTMFEVIMYVVGLLVLMVILSPFFMFMMYVLVFSLSIAWLLFIYGVIGLPWYVIRRIRQQFRHVAHPPGERPTGIGRKPAVFGQRRPQGSTSRSWTSTVISRVGPPSMPTV